MAESETYDIIIAGGGCAGLSLAFQLAGQPTLNHLKILIIERETKQENDRTWCFWEKEPGPFESIVHHAWANAWFKGPSYSKLLNLKPYTYKMIRSERFYQFVHDRLKTCENIRFLKAEVAEMGCDEQIAWVKTSDTTFYADQVFNSIAEQKEKQAGHHYLLQHFMGWNIRTETESFNPDEPVLMDFTIDQKGDCRFMYVLPTSPAEALVEYTIFSENVLSKEEYITETENYISHHLKLKNYEIVQKESGVIPMFSAPFDKNKGKRIINIGTAGGMTKASTGYTFTRIQRHTEAIVKEIMGSSFTKSGMGGWHRRFELYDNVLLHVLAKNIVGGAQIFQSLFRRNKPASVFRFLDEDTHFLEEYRLINTVPIFKFIGPGWKELLKMRK